MAKRTTLELVNSVLKNIGEAGTLTVLTSLTKIELLAFDKLNESIVELAGLAQWMPLEATGTALMLTGTNTYGVPTDLLSEDEDSFRLPQNGNGSRMGYCKSPADWDAAYPKGITTDRPGWPTVIMRFGTYWHINTMPLAAQNNKTINFRYWQRPVLLETAAPTGTCWVPEQMDDLVLVNLATYKVMVYKGSSEASEYYQRVFGRGQNDQGNLTRMKSLYSSSVVRLQIKMSGQFEDGGKTRGIPLHKFY